MGNLGRHLEIRPYRPYAGSIHVRLRSDMLSTKGRTAFPKMDKARSVSCCVDVYHLDSKIPLMHQLRDPALTQSSSVRSYRYEVRAGSGHHWRFNQSLVLILLISAYSKI